MQAQRPYQPLTAFNAVFNITSAPLVSGVSLGGVTLAANDKSRNSLEEVERIKTRAEAQMLLTEIDGFPSDVKEKLTDIRASLEMARTTGKIGTLERNRMETAISEARGEVATRAAESPEQRASRILDNIGRHFKKADEHLDAIRHLQTKEQNDALDEATKRRDEAMKKRNEAKTPEEIEQADKEQKEASDYFNKTARISMKDGKNNPRATDADRDSADKAEEEIKKADKQFEVYSKTVVVAKDNRPKPAYKAENVPNNGAYTPSSGLSAAASKDSSGIGGTTF